MRHTAILKTFLGLFVVLGLAFGQYQTAHASGGPAPAPQAAQSSTGSQMPAAQFKAVKAALDSPASGYTRTATPVKGGVEYTYQHVNGTKLALAVPSKPTGPETNLRVGGCGFLQLCVYFNRTDQGAIIAGAAGGLAAAICAFPAVGQAACIAASAAIAAAAYYLTENGRCGNELRVHLLPYAGFPVCV